MCKSINDYLDNQVRKALGEEFSSFLENCNKKIDSQILTNENFVCFNRNDKEMTLERNEKPIKVMIGIKLPDFESEEAKNFYGSNDTANYDKVVKRVSDELAKHKKFKLECEPNYVKIVNKVPSLSLTIFPYFIKEANQHFYISKGDGEWKQLIEELEVFRIPEETNTNIMKVICLIESYIRKHEILINSSYITYIAFNNLLEKNGVDLKDSLLIVLRKLKSGLKKDKLTYNRIFNLQQTLQRAIQMEKKNPEEAVEFLERFLKQK